ncbi:hypothetical protein AMELA_G00226870 [Ameiurus melas]|uniref:Ig-like domain-containing protein n=1 Tax=Ameiurus melas TaxID=219545 RepID=A0A7J6A2I4_AMEME|nr:hypothetical protein AMELA_G00226870 [Ameiurus melas]
MSSPALSDAPRHTAVLLSTHGPLTEGDSVTLTCSSEGAPEVESFTWFREGESGSVPDSFKPELKLWSLDYRDHGEYFCMARNSIGTERSRPVLVNVTYTPKNTKVLISAKGDIMEGHAVNLICISNANPPVKRYAWYKVIGGQPWAKGSSRNLTFTSVRSHNAGQYYCAVWNVLGMGMSPPVTLSVLCRLKVIALASAVCVSVALITLTVAVMISKNMHRVDSEAMEIDKQLGSPMEVDTLFYECPQPNFQPQSSKMADIPEAVEKTETDGKDGDDGKVKYVTVHYSRTARPSWDQVQVTNLPQDGAEKEPKDRPGVVYSVLAKQP